MDETTLNRKRSALTTILDMDDISIPVLRKNVSGQQNLRWLQRNFLIRNSGHPLAKTVMDLLRQLLQYGQRET